MLWPFPKNVYETTGRFSPESPNGTHSIVFVATLRFLKAILLKRMFAEIVEQTEGFNDIRI